MKLAKEFGLPHAEYLRGGGVSGRRGTPSGLRPPAPQGGDGGGARVVERVVREVVALLVAAVAVVLVDVAELLVAPRRRARELAAARVRAEGRQLPRRARGWLCRGAVDLCIGMVYMLARLLRAAIAPPARRARSTCRSRSRSGTCGRRGAHLRARSNAVCPEGVGSLKVPGGFICRIYCTATGTWRRKGVGPPPAGGICSPTRTNSWRRRC
jgi:hypothetical protein